MSDDAHALLQFCAAKRELSAMDDSTSVERKKHARAASTFRGLLKDQLSSARAECVPIQYGDETRYAVLRPRARTTAVSCEAVLRAVRALRYDASSHASGATLEEWLDAAIRRALQGEGNAPHSSSSSSGAHPPSLPLPPFSTPLSDRTPPHPSSSHAPSGAAQGGACGAEEGGKMTLSILRKLPDGAPPPRPPHPSTASRIQETVNAMREASEAGAALRKRGEARRKELTLAAKQCEERVAAHLSSPDPDHGSRRVKLVPPGGGGGGGKGREAEASYHLRRTTSTRTTRPTVRTALPLVRQVVRALREESGVAEHASWEAYRWLTSPSTLAKLERQLADGFASLSAKKRKARVVMTSL